MWQAHSQQPDVEASLHALQALVVDHHHQFVDRPCVHKLEASEVHVSGLMWSYFLDSVMMRAVVFWTA